MHQGGIVSVIPWPYRLLALAVLGVALVGFGWIKGANHVQAQWDAAVQQQTLQTTAIRERQAQTTVKVVTQYVDRVRIVREKGEPSSRRFRLCPFKPMLFALSTVVLCLHDAAAAGELPFEPA